MECLSLCQHLPSIPIFSARDKYFFAYIIRYNDYFFVFLQKNKRPINEKKHKDILHLIIYSRIHLFLADASTGIRQHQTGRETTLG